MIVVSTDNFAVTERFHTTASGSNLAIFSWFGDKVCIGLNYHFGVFTADMN